MRGLNFDKILSIWEKKSTGVLHFPYLNEVDVIEGNARRQ
jgi:hypothetical protein